MVLRPVNRHDLVKVDIDIFEIPMSFRDDMRVPARAFVNEKMLKDVLKDQALAQLVNVATLPGIVGHAFAMPDIHQGYGFPIGGVAAVDIHNDGIISPGGIGYDINCGVRLLTSSATYKEIRRYLPDLAQTIFAKIPSGVGRGGSLRFAQKELNHILINGARYMVEQGYGTERDLAYCEEQGCMKTADPSLISDAAKQRGADQLGTLGSGNHFLEIQKVDSILHEEAAQAYGLFKDQVVIMIHCGSRGLGHQTCTDYVRKMMQVLPKQNYTLADRELACAPFFSQEGQDYFGAMSASANFAWANRHMIGHWVRQAWHEVISDSIQIETLYDVSHNIGKLETHTVNGENRELLVHRKGATRAFGPSHIETPYQYKSVGQPVLIPGTMGTASYVLSGIDESMNVSFGSCCHGAGRKMSRSQAKQEVHGVKLRKDLEGAGIIICSDSNIGLAEEAPVAYKDIDDVISVVNNTHLARSVARLKPLAVIKGG